TNGTIQTFGLMNRIDRPAAVQMSVTNVAAMIRLPMTDWFSPVSTRTAYTTARLVVESASPAISAWRWFQPSPEYASSPTTTNEAANETRPIETDARHSRLNCGTSTSAPARNVSTTPANVPMNASQPGTSRSSAFPRTNPAKSSISATERPASTD